jgi:hypothetical protein
MFLSRHWGLISRVFIAIFLARGVILDALRCSSAKRRAAFASRIDSDPRNGNARTTRVGQHTNLVRNFSCSS